MWVEGSVRNGTGTAGQINNLCRCSGCAYRKSAAPARIKHNVAHDTAANIRGANNS